jgi:hypothetical protein
MPWLPNQDGGESIFDLSNSSSEAHNNIKTADPKYYRQRKEQAIMQKFL